MTDYSRLRRDLSALGLLAASVFVALSLLSYDPADPPGDLVYPPNSSATNLCGIAGAYLAHGLRQLFGQGSFLLLAGLIAWDMQLFTTHDRRKSASLLIGWGLLVSAGCVGLQWNLPSIGTGPMIGSGGFVGAYGAAVLSEQFQTTGAGILLSSMLTAGLLMTVELRMLGSLFGLVLAPIRLFNRVAFGPVSARAAAWKAERQALSDSRRRAADLLKNQVDDEVSDPVEEEEEETEEPEIDPHAFEYDDEPAATPRKPLKVNPPISAKSARDEIIAQLDANSHGSGPEEYRLPDLDLLEEAEEFPFELLAAKAQKAAEVLERTFREFGLNIRVSEVDTGPVITMFELELEPGLRVSKVSALADDLAIALRVPAVRVVSPVPGKNTVGVEVPNDKQVMVRLRELIETCPETRETFRIPVYLGKDVSGRPLAVDLTKMPHLLIAGRTGTGKSVCLNTLILSMLMTRSPDEVKMLMIDPKMVELSPYRRIPHLMHPVITDMKKAEAVLGWAVDKMEERYDMLARCGVRHLDQFNQLGKDEVLDRLGVDPDSPDADHIPEKMPYIVIIADEMADMIMTSGKDVEGHIIRLAQKSRAVGIHLVLATQKPTVDVITGLIKSNLPARISFQVASRSDSRVVLDEMGADRLLGNGDMLYMAPGTSQLMRAQGAYVSGEEIDGVIDFFSDQEPEYSNELAQLSASRASGKSGAGTNRERDELYDQAVEVIIREGRGSVSLLQRALGVGYGRGARLIDNMAEDGIVGEYNGSQAREVLFTMEQWEELQSERMAEGSFA